MGTKLKAAREELARARVALEQLETARNAPAMDDAWKECIGRLTRLWNKTEASLKGDPRFHNTPWAKRVKDARKNDQVIRYLLQARNADEHGVDDITERGPGYTALLPVKPNGKFHVKSVTIGLDGSIRVVPGETGFRVDQVAQTVAARPVTNYGQTYAVPDEHAQALRGNRALAAMARHGVEFYEAVIEGLAKDGWDQPGA
jgi:hypothetical protein